MTSVSVDSNKWFSGDTCTTVKVQLKRIHQNQIQLIFFRAKLPILLGGTTFFQLQTITSAVTYWFALLLFFSKLYIIGAMQFDTELNFVTECCWLSEMLVAFNSYWIPRDKYEFRISKSLAVFSCCMDLCPPIGGKMPVLLCFTGVTSGLHSFVDQQW